MEKGVLKQNGVHLKEHEYNTVKLLLEQGYDVELIPPSGIKGLRMPDIMMQGIPWEMKSPEGDGRKTIKNAVQSASHQSESIIIDLQRSKIPEDRAIKEIERYFKLSRRLKRLKIVLKDKKILDFHK